MSAKFTWKAIKVSRMLFSSPDTIKCSEMQFTSEQRIFIVSNYLGTKSFKDIK